MRIEKDSRGGRRPIHSDWPLSSGRIEELQKQLRQNRPRVVWDFTELTIVDVDVVGFLGICEVGGVEAVNCSYSRVDEAGTKSISQFEGALKRDAQHDANWPDWYAAYMAAEQAGTELPK